MADWSREKETDCGHAENKRKIVIGPSLFLLFSPLLFWSLLALFSLSKIEFGPIRSKTVGACSFQFVDDIDRDCKKIGLFFLCFFAFLLFSGLATNGTKFNCLIFP